MPNKLQRDRLTLYSYITLLSYVWALYGVGPALLLLREEHDYSRTVVSLHSVALSTGVLLIGLIGDRVTGYLGRARAIQIGSAVVGLGAVLVAYGPAPALSILGTFCIGFGGSMLTNPINAFLTLHHRQNGPAAISESNAGAAFAGLTVPLFMGALVAANIDWRLALVTAVVLFAIGRALRGDGADLNIVAPAHEHSHKRLPALYWWAWLAVGVAMGAEWCFMFWAGDLLRNQAHVSTAVAAAGLSAVAVGMTVSRIASSPLVRHLGLQRLFVGATVIALAMWFPMWFSSNAYVMLGSMFVIGLGIGVHFPIGMSRMLAAAPGMIEEAAARSSLAAGIAGGSMPFILGVLGDAVGIHAAFIMVPVLFGIALFAAVFHPVQAAQ